MYKAALESELEAVTEAQAAQALVSEAVKRREWIDFNASIETVRALSARIDEIENRRLELTRDGGGISGAGLSFYDFVRRFSNDERQILCGLYRQLKFEAARLRFSSEALAAYLGEARLLAAGLLEAAFPEKRGKIYGRSGAERSAKLGGIVLDRRF
jgi:hypothetical protein